MDLSKLGTLPKEDIIAMAEMCHLDTKLSTTHLVRELAKIFKHVEDEKRRYTRVSQLGSKGKEGTVFLVTDRSGRPYAMKAFSSSKSDRNLEREAVLLGKAAEFGISPPLIEYDTMDNFIVMEKLDGNLFDYLRDHKGKMPTRMQKEMIEIFKTLDRIQIFHADPNPLNFMFDSAGKLKIIDFGFSKPIDDKAVREYGTKDVNMRFMPLGFLLKMKDLVPPTNFEHILKYVNEEDRVNVLGIAPQPAKAEKKEKEVKKKSVRRQSNSTPPEPKKDGGARKIAGTRKASRQRAGSSSSSK